MSRRLGFGTQRPMLNNVGGANTNNGNIIPNIVTRLESPTNNDFRGIVKRTRTTRRVVIIYTHTCYTVLYCLMSIYFFSYNALCTRTRCQRGCSETTAKTLFLLYCKTSTVYSSYIYIYILYCCTKVLAGRIVYLYTCSVKYV
jgi:hypothetical protein